jgi:hypothetical protein
MASQFFFNGRLYTTPTVVSAVNDTAEIPVGNTVGNVLAIIGLSDGGQPDVPLPFSNPVDAEAVLLSGELLVAVQKAFAPSSDTDAPGTVIAMRVGQATQASLTLQDGSGNNVITLTSKEYGLVANQVRVSVEAGSVTGLLVTLANGAGAGAQYYEQDNLARTALSVQYTGSQATATIAVTNSTVTLSAPSGTVVATLALANFQTVAALANGIASTPGFTATVIPGTENTPALNGLDTLAAAPCKTSPVNVTANLQAVIDWINSPQQSFATAVRVANAGAPPAVTASGFLYLTGGTYPAPTNLDWTNALNTLQASDVQWIVPLTSAPAIWAAADAHVQYMSQAGQKERRAFVGGAIGTTIAEAEAVPLTINSDRTAYVPTGYYDYDAAGVLTLYEPYMTAACIAAGFAGLSPGDTMTNKSLKVVGLEWSPNNPTDTDPMIQSGVLAVESTTTGFMVVRAISTWLQTNAYNRVEVSCGAATDYMIRTVRTALAVLKGSRGDPLVLGRAISITETALKGLAVPPPQGPGAIVGDATSPAFQNIVASLSGDIVQVSWQASPVIPVNFIGCTVSIQPYSGTATAAQSNAVSGLAS